MAGGSEMKDLYVNVFTIGKYFVNIVYFPKIVRKALLCLQKIHDVHFLKHCIYFFKKNHSNPVFFITEPYI